MFVSCILRPFSFMMFWLFCNLKWSVKIFRLQGTGHLLSGRGGWNRLNAVLFSGATRQHATYFTYKMHKIFQGHSFHVIFHPCWGAMHQNYQKYFRWPLPQLSRATPCSPKYFRGPLTFHSAPHPLPLVNDQSLNECINITTISAHTQSCSCFHFYCSASPMHAYACSNSNPSYKYYL